MAVHGEGERRRPLSVRPAVGAGRDAGFALEDAPKISRVKTNRARPFRERDRAAQACGRPGFGSQHFVDDAAMKAK